MKVLHIITGLNDGGAEAVLYRLATSKNSTFKHSVISLMDGGKYGPLLEEVGVDVYCLNIQRSGLNVFFVFKIFSLIRKLNPDAVQTWMFHGDLFGGLFARLSGFKNIVWGVHHTNLVKGESKRSTIFVAKINALLSHFVPNKIIYCAEKSREVQESIGFCTKKGIVASNGYDVSQYVYNEQLGIDFREELSLSNRFLIGHVGRYDPLKDYSNFLAGLGVLKKVRKDFKSILVGSFLDEKNHELNKLILTNDIKNNVLLCGRRSDIPLVMNGFDVFVLSSISEAFPNVLNEAMACGTPCITTDVGDAARIVGDTGWVVPARDPQALAKAISEAWYEKDNLPVKWLARKKACRERIVNNFSLEKMVSDYESVWMEGIKV